MATNESTAVAHRDPETEALGNQLQTAYQRDRMVRAMAQQIASESWGKNLSPHTQAAMARYAMEAGLDPVRHIDVLGGRVYINAAAYMDRLAADPEFDGVTFDPITDDEPERARWGVPKHALAVFRVTVRHRGREFTEIGYAPKRANDSVGKEFPAEKARTSGIRRAARMAVPMWTQRMEQQFEQVETLIAEGKREIPQRTPTAGLIPAVRRSGDAANDWQSVMVDPSQVKQPVTRVPRPLDVSEAQWEEDQRRAAAGAEPFALESEFPENIHEEP